MSVPSTNVHNFSWQQTMLRIKDPKVSIPFYEDHFGFTVIHKYDFPQWKFALFFLAILPEGEKSPEPGTKESETYCWTTNHVCLELTWNYPQEGEDFKVSSGNVEPCCGFGHIAVMTPNVFAASEKLAANGVRFHQRPNEEQMQVNAMQATAVALDPDGYWIKILARSEHALPELRNMPFTLAQTMLRVKDPAKSLRFYRDILGMRHLHQMDIGKGEKGGYSLFSLANLHDPNDIERIPGVGANSVGSSEKLISEEAAELIRTIFPPVLELTHYHGTEEMESFHYYNGNDQDQDWMVRGFGHIGFLVDDLNAACAYLEEQGVRFKKKPSDGTMHDIAFVFDPDNYWVEIIQRDGPKLMNLSA